MLPTSGKAMKYLLFVFNFVFVLTGIALITVGILIKNSDIGNYEPLLPNDNYVTAPNVLIFIGCFVFFVAFFGCCGSLKENYCMIFTFSVIMVAIFIAEITIGVTGYIMRNEAPEVVAKGLNTSMALYKNSTDMQQLWDQMQSSLHCCGIKNYTDWKEVLHTSDLPLTCCGPKLGAIGVTNCNSTSPTLHKTPCFDAVANFIEDKADSIGFTGITIAFIQLLGVVFSCNLAHMIRKDYESV